MFTESDNKRVIYTSNHGPRPTAYAATCHELEDNLIVFFYFSFFLPLSLSLMGRHTLSSYASAEAGLTGWPNAQPQGWD